MSLVISAHTLASRLALQALVSGGRMSQATATATAQSNVSRALAQTKSKSTTSG